MRIIINAVHANSAPHIPTSPHCTLRPHFSRDNLSRDSPTPRSAHTYAVGFQKRDSENANGTAWFINTFKKVDGSKIVLGDFKINEDQAQLNVHLKFYDKNGAIAYDEQGRMLEFIYVNPLRPAVASQGWVPGWYFYKLGTTNVGANEFKKGDASTYWANEIDLPYGQGFGLSRASLNASITFSGAVAAEDQPLSAENANGTSWLGNVMPTDLKLKDMPLVEDQAQLNVHLKFYDKNGAIAYDDQGRMQEFIFVNPLRPAVKSQGWVPGWYFYKLGTTNVGANEFKKGSASAYWANEIDAPAGKAFGLSRASAATTIKIASPLADKE